ncbi:hypothetical protein ABG768_018780 [Culter alburnus]|uniref:Uncharacterized protein n=1 Tax=Culter alburnus TaxID=194366 RepID=A0AAW2AT86_CULAL
MVNYAWAGRSQGKLWWRPAAVLTCKSVVRPGYRGERLIEPSSSWFPPRKVSRRWWGQCKFIHGYLTLTCRMLASAGWSVSRKLSLNVVEWVECQPVEVRTPGIWAVLGSGPDPPSRA